MNILIITRDLPHFPGGHGGNAREYHLIKELSSRHRFTVVTNVYTADHERHAKKLQLFCQAVGYYREPFEQKEVGQKKAKAFSLEMLKRALVYGIKVFFRGFPAEVARYEGVYQNLSPWIEKFVMEQDFDLLQIVQSDNAHWVERIGFEGPKILICHDAKTIYWYRQFSVETNPFKKVWFLFEALKFFFYERRKAKLFDCLVTTSMRDASAFRRISHHSRVEVVENGVDCEYFHPQGDVMDEKNIVFTGWMVSSSNVDAVLYFHREILPLIKRRFPDLTFTIVGKDPPESVRKLSEDNRIIVTGYVPDTRPYIAKAAVIVVPIRIGSGTRLKILEAMAMGKAIVSTSVGAEGLDCADDENILIADNSETFARRVIELLQDPEKQMRIGTNARKRAVSQYSWEKIGEKLDRIYQSLLTPSDVNQLPLVSIITSSFNQGKYIEETIRSVMSQDYPRIEHIIVDGGSTDETISILKKYPHLKWISEPDRGQSHAINKGFQMATGEIITWLNSDDTYLPGAVKAAVRALDKSKGRYVVMGRCPFIDENGNPTGVYHPSAYRTRRDLIKIWKGLYSIPQPAVFFYKELIDEFGGLDESLYFAMDYELWLRFSKKYFFFPIKRALATYRLHSASKSMELSEQELLKKTVEISRRYWGSKGSPYYWYYYLSYRLSQIFLWRISNRYWTRSADYYNQRKWFRAAFYLLIALSIYPPMILRKKYVLAPLIKTYISKKIGNHFDRFMVRSDPSQCDGKVHSDGWVSDYASLPLEISPLVKRLEILGDAYLRFFGNTPLSIKVFLNGSLVENRVLNRSGEFRIPVTLQDRLKPSHNELRLYPDKIFIPQALGEGPDKRRLSFIYKGIVLFEDGGEV